MRHPVTSKDRLDEVQGFGPGFELTRLALARAVVLWHAVVITTSEAEARATLLCLFAWALVPMFFVLSGFLVAESVLRLRARDYLLNRSARIHERMSARGEPEGRADFREHCCPSLQIPRADAAHDGKRP